MREFIYISYSQKDSEFVDKLSTDLLNAGLDVWYDRKEIHPGDNWIESINEALSKASYFLFISSRYSIESDWTKYELGRFAAENIKILPIIIDDIGAEKLPDFLKAYQWIDFRINYTDAVKKLIKTFPVSFLNHKNEIVKPNISKGYVFLSYCEGDRAFILKLRQFLKDNGYAYWDYEESNRDYHKQYFFELESAIIEAAATLSVLSPDWKQSEWALKEYFFSLEVKTPVFLLKAKPMPPTLPISGVPFIDFTKNDTDGFEKLSRELKRKNIL